MNMNMNDVNNDVNLILFVTNVVVVVMCGAFSAIIPTLTRKSYLFGVKIPLEQQLCPEAKSMKKRYVTVICLCAAAMLMLCVLQYAFRPDLSLIAVMYIPLLIVPVQLIAFVPNWKRALRLKEARGWRVSGATFAETGSSHSRGTMSELPWAWYAVSLALVFFSLVAALVKYPSLPDPVPTHFDINMQPDAWTAKSLGAVLMTPLLNLGTLVVLWLSGIAIVKAKLQIDPASPALSFAQHRMYRKRMGHSLGFLTLAIAATVMLPGLLILWPELSIPFWLVVALPTAAIVPVLVVGVRSGQGGCKLKPRVRDVLSEAPGGGPQATHSRLVPGRGDDKHWVLGMFYYNPEDPAHIVEDRFGTSLGFNYARLPVKIGAAAFLLLFVGGYAWLTVLLQSIPLT